jgi:hypothetical protein
MKDLEPPRGRSPVLSASILDQVAQAVTTVRSVNDVTMDRRHRGDLCGVRGAGCGVRGTLQT